MIIQLLTYIFLKWNPSFVSKLNIKYSNTVLPFQSISLMVKATHSSSRYQEKDHVTLKRKHYLRQSIQEWTKKKLWKTAFKKFQLLRSAWVWPYHFLFLKAVFHKFYLVHSSILCPIYNKELIIRFSHFHTFFATIFVYSKVAFF